MSDRDMEQSDGQPTGMGSGAQTPEGSTQDSSRASRRRFLTAGAAVAPVIMTLTSRPAQAGLNCTYSAWASAPGSLRNRHLQDANCMHMTPTEWKWNPGAWPSGTYCQTTTKWNEVFTSPNPSAGSTTTLIDVLMGGDGDLYANAVAAYLNAKKWSPSSFTYSSMDIKSSWTAQAPPAPNNMGNYLLWLQTINGVGIS